MEVEGAFFNTSDYKIRPKKLGKGLYGKVYVAEHVNNHQEFAIKVIDINSGFDGNDQMLFLHESFTLKRLNHIAIVKLNGINFQSYSDPKTFEPTILMEYFGRGSLKNNLNKTKKIQHWIQIGHTQKNILIY